MYTTALLIVSPLAGPLAMPGPATAPAPIPTPIVQDDEAPDEEYLGKLSEAGTDAEKLMELAAWCKENDRHPQAREVYRKVIEADSNHKAARKALRHHFYDDQWFETYVSLSNYKRAEAKRMLEEHGKVRFGDDWVLQADVPYLRMQWERDDSGNWVNPVAKARAEMEAKLLEEGWQVQGLDWIPPDQVANWTEGSFWCGEEWLPKEQADEYHATFQTAWQIPGENFKIVTTTTYDNAQWARYWADLCYADLVRAFGATPKEKPAVYVMNALDQYNTFAAGDQATQQPGAEAEGLSSAHYAFFADMLFGGGPGGVPEYLGSGACFWDSTDEKLAGWGQFAVRHATALAYANAVAPSWGAISQAISSQSQLSIPQFWSEKPMPRWFIYGMAAYSERFFIDKSVGDEGDPNWARNFGLGEFRKGPGLRENLDEVFTFAVNANDLEGSNQLIFEAGVISAFVLDGGCEPVAAAHEALRKAIMDGSDTAEQTTALQEAIKANADTMRTWAEL